MRLNQKSIIKIFYNIFKLYSFIFFNEYNIIKSIKLKGEYVMQEKGLDFRHKEVVNINDGKRLGFVQDVCADLETGAITYSVYYYAKGEEILEVPKESFIPEPEVTSKVIKLNIRKEAPVKVKSPEVMFRIIKCAFMQRRKTLLNALVNTRVFLNKEEGMKVLKKLNLNENVRAENLTLQNFANITRYITICS